MKFTIDQFLGKAVGGPPTDSKKADGDIEILSSDMALKVRGGDKDYSPTYEHRLEKGPQFTNPSVLLKI